MSLFTCHVKSSEVKASTICLFIFNSCLSYSEWSNSNTNSLYPQFLIQPPKKKLRTNPQQGFHILKRDWARFLPLSVLQLTTSSTSHDSNPSNYEPRILTRFLGTTHGTFHTNLRRTIGAGTLLFNGNSDRLCEWEIAQHEMVKKERRWWMIADEKPTPLEMEVNDIRSLCRWHSPIIHPCRIRPVPH